MRILDELKVYGNNALLAAFNGDGSVGVGVGTNSAKFHIKGLAADPLATTFKVNSDIAANAFEVTYAGAVNSYVSLFASDNGASPSGNATFEVKSDNPVYTARFGSTAAANILLAKFNGEVYVPSKMTIGSSSLAPSSKLHIFDNNNSGIHFDLAGVNDRAKIFLGNGSSGYATEELYFEVLNSAYHFRGHIGGGANEILTLAGGADPSLFRITASTRGTSSAYQTAFHFVSETHRGGDRAMMGSNTSDSNTSGSHYGGYFESIGANTGTANNVALYSRAINGVNNYAGIFENGHVGIGTTAPTSSLHIQESGATYTTLQINNSTSTTGYSYGLDVFVNSSTAAGNRGMRMNVSDSSDCMGIELTASTSLGVPVGLKITSTNGGGGSATAIRVMSGDVIIDGLSGTGTRSLAVDSSGKLVEGSGGGALPKERVVYLVNDTEDATAMGGATNHVYTTAQAAYDAADTLQQSLGDPHVVTIMVGNTEAGTVGGVTLTADWNKYVYIMGIDPSVSKIGDIVATSTTTKGHDVGVYDLLVTNNTYPLYISNATVGNITTNYTGTMTGAEASGAVTLVLYNAVVGNIDTSINDVTESGSFPGWVNINFDPNYTNYVSFPKTSIVGNITSTGNSVVGGFVSVSNLGACGAITTSTDVNVNPGSVTLVRVDYINGNIDSQEVYMYWVENYNGNISMKVMDMQNCGIISGFVTSTTTDPFINVEHVKQIGKIDISNATTTSQPMNFANIGRIVEFDFSSAGSTHAVIISNCVIPTLTFSNTTFGDTALVTKNCSLLVTSFTKTIHKNFAGSDFTVNLIGVSNDFNFVMIHNAGSAIGIDNLSKALTGLVVFNTTANAVTGGLNIGTSAGGAQVVSALAVAANAELYIDDATILKRLFNASPTQTIYVSDVTSWNSAVLNISFLFKEYK